MDELRCACENFKGREFPAMDSSFPPRQGNLRPEAKTGWNARMSLKRILITNDDGINAPGIKALEQSLAALGEVTVIAPDREMSATSQSISLFSCFRVH